jgi:hypothetical protein
MTKKISPARIVIFDRVKPVARNFSDRVTGGPKIFRAGPPTQIK